MKIITRTYSRERRGRNKSRERVYYFFGKSIDYEAGVLLGQAIVNGIVNGIVAFDSLAKAAKGANVVFQSVNDAFETFNTDQRR